MGCGVVSVLDEEWGGLGSQPGSATKYAGLVVVSYPTCPHWAVAGGN